MGEGIWCLIGFAKCELSFVGDSGEEPVMGRYFWFRSKEWTFQSLWWCENRQPALIPKKNLSENNHSLMVRKRHNRIRKPCQIKTVANDTVEK
jgi:hypothetical protein